MVVCSTKDSDITKSSVDDGVVLSNLTVGVTYTVTYKACNDVDNSTLSATSDPIVASTLANPPYITKVVITRRCGAHGVLKRGLERRASVQVFTGEMLVISDLVAKYAYWFSVLLVLRQVSHHFPPRHRW